MMSGDRGFTLLELMLALTLGAVVLAGLIHLALAMTVTAGAQRALAGLQTTARFAESELLGEIAGAGYAPEPWNGPGPPALDGSADAVGTHSDRLVLRRWSRRNCLDNDNPVRDATGAPALGLRQSVFELRDGRRLVESCHYGPGPGPGTRQLNAATLVEGVEAFQLLFAEDLDRDGSADRWVRGGAWTDESRILGLRLAMLVASPAPAGAGAAGPIQVLDHRTTPPDDGRLRLLIEATAPLRGRLP